MYLPSGDHVGPESAKLSLVMLVTCCVSRSSMKMSPTAPCRPANTTFLPSGEKSGDSGSSTVLHARSSPRSSRVRTFCDHERPRLLARARSSASRSPRRRPRHPRHRVEAARPASMMNSQPFVLVEAVGQVADDASRPSPETSTMSSSPSFAVAARHGDQIAGGRRLGRDRAG